jgi:hypothetical protein
MTPQAIDGGTAEGIGEDHVRVVSGACERTRHAA